MSKSNYNKKRYLELLKLKVSKDRVLTSVEKAELDEYSILLAAMVDWEIKEQYIDLLEKLISGKINSSQFYFKFLERYHLTVDIPDILEANFVLLSPHENADEFSELICDIKSLCISFEEIFEPFPYLPNEKYDSDCLKFRNYMEEIYFKIQKILNQE